MTKQRFEYIDALRGWAIFGVIIAHAGSITKIGGILGRLAVVGSSGVYLFFVISAFTIFYSLDKHRERENKVRDFFIRRLFRIIPVYWMGIFLYTVVYGLQSRGWREGPELWHYPTHFLLVNVLHPLTSSSVVPGGWSISCEVLFYALVPFLYYRLKSTQDIIIFVFISLTIIPIISNQLDRVLSPILFGDIDKITLKTFWVRWLPSQLACFGFGILLTKLVNMPTLVEKLSDKRRNVGLIVLLSALLLLPIPGFLLIAKHHVHAFIFMCLAFLLSIRPWQLLVNSATIFLGKISFSCYLLHFLVLKQITNMVEFYLPALKSNAVLYFVFVTVLALILTVPLAWLSYKYIETTAINAGRNLIDHLNRSKRNQTIEV
ncbi:acyltransferase family protein [Dyadobacter bucti]|uniref:acyltransferase family protein n=1 Tax=Dyadobacter bucti TaxID=2572203 RepID=UPI0011086D51|nr:acyltransferase [Dyadobacter bucti]